MSNRKRGLSRKRFGINQNLIMNMHHTTHISIVSLIYNALSSSAYLTHGLDM
jgi:hypothetical protein